MVVIDSVNMVPVARRQTHEGRISSVAFIDEGSVACTSEDGTIRIIAVPSLEEVFHIQLALGPLYSIGLVRNEHGKASSAVVAGVGGGVWHLELSPGAKPTRIADLRVNAIWSVDINPRTGRVALGMDDGTIGFIDLADGSTVVTRSAHQRQVWCVRWSTSGNSLASASEEGEVAIWDEDGQVIRRLTPPLLYEGVRITGSEGLMPAERRHLLSLGALQ
jgi:WD40 repeat protein